MTFPLIGQNGTSTWAGELGNGILEHTLLTVVGVGNGWLAAAPVVAAIATAIVLAARATPRARLSDARLAAGALAAWVLIFVFGPDDRGRPGHAASRRHRRADARRGRRGDLGGDARRTPLSRAARRAIRRAVGSRADGLNLVDHEIAVAAAGERQPAERLAGGVLPRRSPGPVRVQDHRLDAEALEQLHPSRIGEGLLLADDAARVLRVEARAAVNDLRDTRPWTTGRSAGCRSRARPAGGAAAPARTRPTAARPGPSAGPGCRTDRTGAPVPRPGSRNTATAAIAAPPRQAAAPRRRRHAISRSRPAPASSARPRPVNVSRRPGTLIAFHPGRTS